MSERLTERTEMGSLIQKGEVSTRQMIDKLGAYEELEEQGLLLKLPRKVGDIVYKIITQHDSFDDTPYKIVSAVNFRLDMLDEIGKTVFLTQHEAEEKLRELEGYANNKEKDTSVIKDSFLEKCMNGDADLSQLEDYVIYWHTHDMGISLRDYLGLTPDEYAAWEKGDDSVFEDFLQSRIEEFVAFVASEQELD